MEKKRIFLYGTWAYHKDVTKKRSPSFIFDKQTEYKKRIIIIFNNNKY